MNADIKAYLDDAEKALGAYRNRVTEVQAMCPHHRVLHAGYSPSRSGLLPGLHQARICLECGMEEQSSARTAGAFVHLKTEFVKACSHDDL